MKSIALFVLQQHPNPGAFQSTPLRSTHVGGSYNHVASPISTQSNGLRNSAPQLQRFPQQNGFREEMGPSQSHPQNAQPASYSAGGGESSKLLSNLWRSRLLIRWQFSNAFAVDVRWPAFLWRGGASLDLIISLVPAMMWETSASVGVVSSSVLAGGP